MRSVVPYLRDPGPVDVSDDAVIARLRWLRPEECPLHRYDVAGAFEEPVIELVEPTVDMADVSWSTAGLGRIISGILYADRRLTRWEWVKVRILRRRDPRFLGTIEASWPEV